MGSAAGNDKSSKQEKDPLEGQIMPLSHQIEQGNWN